MTEKEVSNTFLDFLIVPKDLEKSKVNVDNFKSVFDEAVQKAVEAKIPTHVPGGSSAGTPPGGNLNIKSFKHKFNQFK